MPILQGIATLILIKIWFGYCTMLLNTNRSSFIVESFSKGKTDFPLKQGVVEQEK